MDPDPLVRGMDTDSDPSTINKSSKKKTLISTVLCLLFDFLSLKNDVNKCYCLLLFKSTFTSFFKDKKSKRSHKTVGIKVYLTIFA